MRHIAVSRAIDAGGEYMHLMAGRSESAAQRMHGVDRPAIADGRIICGHDVQNFHSLRMPISLAV